MKTFIITTCLIIGFAVGAVLYHAGGDGEDGVVVKYGPTHPWIEVCHDGALTSEWQPSDGAVYRFLVQLLEDGLHGDGGKDNDGGTHGGAYLMALL